MTITHDASDLTVQLPLDMEHLVAIEALRSIHAAGMLFCYRPHSVWYRGGVCQGGSARGVSGQIPPPGKQTPPASR